MIEEAAESVVLVWIKVGETPESPGVNLDQVEHFSSLKDALLASYDPARYPHDRAPWIKTPDKWMSPEDIRQASH